MILFPLDLEGRGFGSAFLDEPRLCDQDIWVKCLHVFIDVFPVLMNTIHECKCLLCIVVTHTLHVTPVHSVYCYSFSTEYWLN